MFGLSFCSIEFIRMDVIILDKNKSILKFISAQIRFNILNT